MDIGGVIPVGALADGKEITLPRQSGIVRLSSLAFSWTKTNSSSAGDWSTVVEWRDGEGNVFAFAAAKNTLGGTSSVGKVCFALMVENNGVQTGLSATDSPGQLVSAPLPGGVLLPPNSSIVVGWHGDGIGALGDIVVPTLTFRLVPL